MSCTIEAAGISSPTGMSLPPLPGRPWPHTQNHASLSATALATLTKQPRRDVYIAFGREGEVAQVDALVCAVDERPGVQQALVALREEAVGDAPREGRPEVPR